MSALYTEITTDPLNIGYAQYVSTRNDAAIANLLNAPNYTLPGWISITAFNTWCAAHNAEYLNIVTLSTATTSPFYASANALLRVLNGVNPLGAFDMSDASIISLFNAWPFIDTTGASKAALVSLGEYPASRAQILKIDASAGAVSFALNIGGA